MDKFIETLLGILEESNTVEFKRLSGGRNNTTKIITSIVAMANSEGGEFSNWN